MSDLDILKVPYYPDIPLIRDGSEAFGKALERRSKGEFAAQIEEVRDVEDQRRSVAQEVLRLAERRRHWSRDIAVAKSKGETEQVAFLSEQVKKLKPKLQELGERERELVEKRDMLFSALPNPHLVDVPDGADETSNVEQYRFGEQPQFGFAPRDHVEIGKGLGGMDFSTAAKLSGARFVVLRGALARLERALGAFMLDMHTGEHGYQEVAPPFLVRSETMFGTAQLPKFAEDQFSTQSNLWLIPTSEVPLTNLVCDQILAEEKLPLRVTAMTPCFRKEAGAAGRDTHGMIRQHQFSKVELVSVTRPEEEESVLELKRMLDCAEAVLKRLELHYRVMELCAGDLGFAAAKTYDIEVWLPGQGAYREISSCSLCGEFQARRMGARFRRRDGTVGFVHTLNGSGVALGRALLALLEQKQQEDGSVVLPEALHPYMGGATRLEKEQHDAHSAYQ